ncbi:UNVERIFIED_CONTAM: hypothetical protein NY603_39680, partial [Bacteroidetes bacterium 56_B9]
LARRLPGELVCTAVDTRRRATLRGWLLLGLAELATRQRRQIQRAAAGRRALLVNPVLISAAIGEFGITGATRPIAACG